MDNFIRSGKQVSDTIIKDELKKNLEKQKNEINQGKGLSYENVRYDADDDFFEWYSKSNEFYEDFNNSITEYNVSLETF